MEDSVITDKRFTRFCPVGHDKALVGRNKRGICLECDRIRSKKRHKEFKDERNTKQRYYDKAHKEQRNIRNKFKLRSDISYKLRQNLRSRLCIAIRTNQKSGSAVKDLGCTIEELKKYLESKFTSGMSRSNWGRGFGKWNIDHILPLSKFDLSDRQQFLKIVHYTNLQPLWFKDNLKKE